MKFVKLAANWPFPVRFWSLSEVALGPSSLWLFKIDALLDVANISILLSFKTLSQIWLLFTPQTFNPVGTLQHLTFHIDTFLNSINFVLQVQIGLDGCKLLGLRHVLFASFSTLSINLFTLSPFIVVIWILWLWFWKFYDLLLMWLSVHLHGYEILN